MFNREIGKSIVVEDEGTTQVSSAGTFDFVGTGVTVTGDGDNVTVTINGIQKNEVTGTSQNASVNNSYTCNNVALVTVTLPSTAAVGDIVRIVGKGSGGWKLAQNASQTIYFGSDTTTTGTSGSLASTHRRDCVTVECVTANTDWVVTDSQAGSITVA